MPLMREQVIAEAETWVGTRWLHQASCKGAGTDCIGLIAGVAANCGSLEAQQFLATPEWRRYPRTPQPEFMYKVCDLLMDRVQLNELKVADVMMFRDSSNRHPIHFGFLVPGNKMIHAWAVVKKVAKHQLDQGWREKLVRVYRLRGIE